MWYLCLTFISNANNFSKVSISIYTSGFFLMNKRKTIWTIYFPLFISISLHELLIFLKGKLREIKKKLLSYYFLSCFPRLFLSIGFVRSPSSFLLFSPEIKHDSLMAFYCWFAYPIFTFGVNSWQKNGSCSSLSTTASVDETLVGIRAGGP